MSDKFSLGDEQLTFPILTELASKPNPAIKVSEARKKLCLSFRKIVNDAVDAKRTVYGINTGFGFLADVTIEATQLSKLQENIVRSHACAVGKPVSSEIARAVLILRAHTFLLGHSGVSLDVIDTLLAMLRHDIIPVIPEQGSVGASGDLAPLAHVALCMLGEGQCVYAGQEMAAKEAFQKAELRPLKLQPKEGLALINGTQFMSAIAAHALTEAQNLLFAANIISALSLNAIRGTKTAFDKRIHAIRMQKGQKEIAQVINQIFSQPDAIMASHKDCKKVQDPYSFRCIPQVHGTSLDALRYSASAVNNELNSVTDNPLVFPDGDILSGGNFHGQPVAMAMDFLAIAVAELGSISEQRLQRMINPQMSGLPAFLVENSGLNSGFMIPHVVCAALVSENKIYCHPASVDSIPTSADKEDHVSMGPIAARKARAVNANVAKILAIEALGAAQGIDILKPLKPNQILQKLHTAIRAKSAFMPEDRALHAEIANLSDWILSGEMRRLFAKEKLECEI